jgi:hypothetical protein
LGEDSSEFLQSARVLVVKDDIAEELTLSLRRKTLLTSAQLLRTKRLYSWAMMWSMTSWGNRNMEAGLANKGTRNGQGVCARESVNT